jgi:hypothetical protein
MKTHCSLSSLCKVTEWSRRLCCRESQVGRDGTGTGYGHPFTFAKKLFSCGESIS